MKRTLRLALPLCLVLAAAPAVAQYCTSTSNLTNCASLEEYIGNVTLGTLNHGSTCMNAPAFEDYTAIPGPTLSQLSGTQITVTVGNWFSTTDTVTVFFDWNANNILNDAGEVFPLLQGVGNSGGNTLYTGTITPPSGSAATTRMRVKTVYGSSANPCGSSSWSNTEDYTVHTSPPTGLVATGLASPNPVVAGNPVLFTVSVSATSPPIPPTGVTAVIDLSSIGGSAAQVMSDDGVNGGDLTAGDNVFSWAFAPSTNGNFVLPYGAIDSLARVSTGTISVGASPANDVCAASLPVFLGTNGPFTNVLGTDSGVVGSCVPGYKDVWFNFTPPCTGPYKIDTCTPAAFDSVLTVYSACGSGELACNNNGTSCGVGAVIPSIALTAGLPVYIRVASNSSTGVGAFNLNINQVFVLAYSSPFGPGSIQFNLTGGPQGGTYFNAITFAAGNFPNGWLYGVDITFPEIVGLITFGFPFVGPLDFCGNAQIGPVTGAPSNLTLYSVGLASPGPLGLPTHVTPPVTYTIP